MNYSDLTEDISQLVRDAMLPDLDPRQIDPHQHWGSIGNRTEEDAS